MFCFTEQRARSAILLFLHNAGVGAAAPAAAVCQGGVRPGRRRDDVSGTCMTFPIRSLLIVILVAVPHQLQVPGDRGGLKRDLGLVKRLQNESWHD